MGGLTAVPDDHIATVVTTLEMTRPQPPRAIPDSPLRLEQWIRPNPARYRALFTRVGGPWLWYSRLAMDDVRLTAIIHHPDQSVFAVTDADGEIAGMLELHHRRAGECAIDYFALVPKLTGQGHGRWLMAEALTLAWRPGVTRVWVNTCTLDHPAALGFYRAQGFVAVRRTLETFPDPRVAGLLPADAAPQIPCLAAPRRQTIVPTSSTIT